MNYALLYFRIISGIKQTMLMQLLYPNINKHCFQDYIQIKLKRKIFII